MQLEYDLISKQEKNMKVLKSIEGGVTKILADVPYIAVYEFDIDTSAWRRMGVEGSAFVTANDDHKGKKSADVSKHSFIVLNKKGPDDLVLDLSKVQNIKIQGVYLMVRCAPPTNSRSRSGSGVAAASSILAFWFHQNEDMQKIYQALTNIVGTGNWKCGNHLLSALKRNSSNSSNSILGSSSSSGGASSSVVESTPVFEEKSNNNTTTGSSNNKSSALLALIQAPPKAAAPVPVPANSPSSSTTTTSASAMLLGAIKKSPTTSGASFSPKSSLGGGNGSGSNSSSNGQGKQLLNALKSSGSNNGINNVNSNVSSNICSAASGANPAISGPSKNNLDLFLDCDIAAAQQKKPHAVSNSVIAVTDSYADVDAAAVQRKMDNGRNGGAENMPSSNNSGLPLSKGSLLLSALKAPPTTAGDSKKISGSDDVPGVQNSDEGLSSPLSRMLLPLTTRTPSPDVPRTGAAATHLQVKSAAPAPPAVKGTSSAEACAVTVPPVPPTTSSTIGSTKAKLFSLSDLEGML